MPNVSNGSLDYEKLYLSIMIILKNQQTHFLQDVSSLAHLRSPTSNALLSIRLPTSGAMATQIVKPSISQQHYTGGTVMSTIPPQNFYQPGM